MTNSWKEGQPVVFQTIKRAIEHDKVSHAYIFEGEQGTPLEEAAIFLAQSLLAHEHSLACETCETCLRVAQFSHADFIYIDGSESSIKRNDIEYLQAEFKKSAQEGNNRKVYWIHCVENATTQALNSLLKFLEEPSSEIIGIFTTNTIEKVIPTIRSRCQILHFQPIPFLQTYEGLQKQVEELDAYLLAKIAKNERVGLTLLEQEEYLIAKEVFKEWIETYDRSKPEAMLLLQIGIKNRSKTVNEKQTLQLCMKMMKIFFMDCLSSHQVNTDMWYTSFVQRYQREDVVYEDYVYILMDTIDKSYGVSIQMQLLVDQMMIRLMEVKS